MVPIIRRSSFLYLAHLVVFWLCAPMLLSQGPGFEWVPLLVPVWLSSSVLFSENAESYAFLRMLPVTDRAVVRAKFGIILSASAVHWIAFTVLAVVLADTTGVGYPTEVFVTFACGFSLLVAALWQIAIWRFGYAVIQWFILGYMVWNLIFAIALFPKTLGPAGWEGISKSAFILPMAQIAWITLPLTIAVVLAAFYGLMQLGVRVKQSSEACL